MSHVPLDEARPLDLEHQKKRAKELSRALAAGDSQALARFRIRHPKARGLTEEQIRLRLAKVTEAQLVVARELGLPSWARLRQHIGRHAEARLAVAAGASVLDGDVPTTHVRCGTDIRVGLVRAGLTGAFVEFVDPLCQGPVPLEGDPLEIRARFVASAYDIPLPLARQDLARQMYALEATTEAGRVVLWFEHDAFDQLILARILAFYAERGAPRTLELVQVNRYPGVDRFKGLGELSAAALRMLWDDRHPVDPAMLELGAKVWEALRQPSPSALGELTRASDALPELGPAVLRHLQELPWRGDGLSLTERMALQIVAGGPLSAGEAFARFGDRDTGMHLGLGDSMFFAMLRRLAAAPSPPIVIARGSRESAHRDVVTLSPAGRRLVAGELDWLTTRPLERWVGGVRVSPGMPDWRWDPSTAAPVLAAPG
jgi:hypothetical protein